MQLWKKNVYFVSLLFQLILFTALFIWLSTTFQQSLTKEINIFRQIQRESNGIIETISENPPSSIVTNYIRTTHEQQGVYFELFADGALIFSSIPEGYPVNEAREINRLEKNKQLGMTYFTTTTITNIKDKEIQTTFLMDATPLYQEQNKRLILSLLIGLFLALLINLVIYWQLKIIYKPIQQLSHELRTPLTLISGYSELLSRVKTTEEEKVDISQQIYREASQLQETIEQLLIMGDLEEGAMLKSPLLLSDLVKSLISKYPLLIIKIQDERTINGSEVLLIRLLDNLLDNAFKASPDAKLTITGKVLSLTNHGQPIAEKTLKKLNSRKKLSPGEYDGTGQGFIICQDIVRLHEGKIEIRSNSKETKVTINF